MKKSLSFNETVLVGLLMFGLFFGAGNLIFPIMEGYQAGANLWPATTGFLVTAATLPVIGIVAAALSRNEDMFTLTSPVCKGYAYFYSIALYLSIGPAFAIPRTAAVSFEIGVKPFISAGSTDMALLIFSLLFFGGVLLLALRPTNIMAYIGKYLTPAFLLFLAVLLVAVIVMPVGGYSQFPAQGSYAEAPFAYGFLDGYNTMDALASVIFCLIIITSVRKLGITEPKYIAAETFKAGIFCTVAMAVIYAALTYMGAVSANVVVGAENGGQIFSEMSGHYFGVLGQLLIAAIVILACFKTALGLVVAGAEFFNRIIPVLSVKGYIYGITLVSFLIANKGLGAIISGAIPFLFFLYPLTIVVIILALLYPWIQKDSRVYRSAILLTLVAASFDFVKYLPEVLSSTSVAKAYVGIASTYLPFFDLGFGWVVPAAVGLVLGFILRMTGSKSVTE